MLWQNHISSEIFHCSNAPKFYSKMFQFTCFVRFIAIAFIKLYEWLVNCDSAIWCKVILECFNGNNLWNLFVKILSRSLSEHDRITSSKIQGIWCWIFCSPFGEIVDTFCDHHWSFGALLAIKFDWQVEPQTSWKVSSMMYPEKAH